MLMIRSRKQAGDTIVEVLIASAIVGLVLTGAFAVANASYKQIRMAQERGEAQRIAQGQTEQIEGLVQSNLLYVTNPAPPSPYPFCFHPISGAAVVASSADCAQGTEGRYRISIARTAGLTDNHTFTVTVTWDSLNGRQDRVAVDYRVKANP